MLFNLIRNGSVELQDLTGIFSAANDFESISGEIESATATVTGLVGEAVITAAEESYQSGNDNDFVRAVRRPIAILAVAAYSAQTLVSHDDTGRKIKADDNEKVPFQWMIDRDDQAQRDKFYKAMDALYRYLEANEVPGWMDSEQRAELGEMIISDIAQVDTVFPIDRSFYVYFKLLPLFKEAQPVLIRKVGAEQWAALLDGKNLTVEQKLLRGYCRRHIVLKAIQTAVKRWSLSVFPLEIARRFAPSYQGNKESRVATLEEIDRFLSNIESELKEIDCIIAELISGSNPYSGISLVPDGDRHDKFFSAQ